MSLNIFRVLKKWTLVSASHKMAIRLFRASFSVSGFQQRCSKPDKIRHAGQNLPYLAAYEEFPPFLLHYICK